MFIALRQWSRSSWRHVPVLILTIALGAAACTMGLRRRSEDAPGPRQGWMGSHGPVIPHDKFPADCSLCHVSTGWREIKQDFAFDHEKETGVALPGAHARAECLRCHNDRGPVAMFAQMGCVGCHQDVHRGKLGKGCEDCHGQENWSPKEQVARHARTRFPLVGAHAATTCWRCHPGAQVGNYYRADTRCESCHQESLARATSPDHQMEGWTHDCQQCHVPTTWAGAGFNHSWFPLTGAHASQPCIQCHVGGVYHGTPSACVGCHQADYNGTTNPNHAAAGFPVTCQTCHNTTTWGGAGFIHSWFPLTGAHATTPCAQCHVGGVYQGTPTACVGCHQADYSGTTNPNHAAAGFPVTCQTCHSTTSWAGATFNHSFPITSGPHAGHPCSACHANPSDFHVFSCTTCHQQAQTNSHHQGVNGYSYNSQACLSCHPHGH